MFKTKERRLFVIAGAFAGLAGIALAQDGSRPASGPVALPAPVTPPVAETPVAAPEAPAAPVSDAAALAAMAQAAQASAAGDARGAERAWREALTLAPIGDAGDKIAADAAKRLGFSAIERRDPRGAETFFAAEAVILRRMHFAGRASARAFSDAVGRWASATGSMGRSNESAALVFYAQEIRARAQAAASAEALNRDAKSLADQVGPVRVSVGELCAVGRDGVLKDRVTCDDEAGARAEALSLQARQIRASAPPPPTKEEREAKAKAKKGGS